MKNNFLELKFSYTKNEKLEIPNFLIKEDDITRLFLIRLLVYRDVVRGLITDDSFRRDKVINIIHLPYIHDVLAYKLSLYQEIKTIIPSDDFLNNSYKYRSYISATLLHTDEKEKIYSILDNRLFCYYLWAHTIKEEKVKEWDHGIYFPDNERAIYQINKNVFIQKIAMFHEQRKLIVIFDLENNLEKTIHIEIIKNNWREICKHGFIIKLDENNPEFVEWVLQYTIKFIETDSIYEKRNIRISSLFHQQMVTIKDKIETCYTLMNIYIFRKDVYLAEFKKKISLAIAQQERRNRAKKSLSPIKLSKQHEEKLKELAKYQKIPKQKILEGLIDIYYDDVNKI